MSTTNTFYNTLDLTEATQETSNLDRILCGTNTWCYYLDLYPTTNITSETVSIISETNGGESYHQIYIKSKDYACINPTIDVIFEEIDFGYEPLEYFDVYDENDTLLSRCTGNSDFQCGNWLTCINNKYLEIPQIDQNDEYEITIQGSGDLHALCNGYSLNIELTITCGGG